MTRVEFLTKLNILFFEFENLQPEGKTIGLSCSLTITDLDAMDDITCGASRYYFTGDKFAPVPSDLDAIQDAKPVDDACYPNVMATYEDSIKAGRIDRLEMIKRANLER